MVESAGLPVTVKIRLGWERDRINCVEIARRIEDAGAYWITVHARTRDQFYGGRADWDKIGEVKAAVSIPVVGNGDVDSPQAAARLLAAAGCDHVMVGRGHWASRGFCTISSITWTQLPCFPNPALLSGSVPLWRICG